MASRLATLLGLGAVTALLVAYGSSDWSWLAGPVAALVVWTLDRANSQPPAEAPPAQRPLVLEPGPVE